MLALRLTELLISSSLFDVSAKQAVLYMLSGMTAGEFCFKNFLNRTLLEPEASTPPPPPPAAAAGAAAAAAAEFC